MAVVRICSFRIMRTKLRKAKSCNGEKFVNYWMHNGFVRVNEEKMSKSLGNFFILRDVLEIVIVPRKFATSLSAATTAAS